MSLDLSKIIHNVTIDNKPVAIYNKADTLSPFLVPTRKLTLTSSVFGNFIRSSVYHKDPTLEEITIDSTIGSVWGKAFAECSNLRKATIEGETFYIESSAFQFCSALKEVYFPNAVEITGGAYGANEGGFYGSPIEIFSAPKVVSLMFSRGLGRTALSSIYLPECTTLGTQVFSGAKIAQATLNEFPKLSTVGSSCFEGCTSLENVNLGLTSLGTSVFKSCINLKTASLPNLEVLTARAFEGCRNLETAYLPNVSQIDYGGFTGCYNLKSIDIPKLETLNSRAFQGCSNLKSINFSKLSEISGDYMFAGCFRLSQVSLPMAKSIPEYAFSSCYALESVDLPACETVGVSAFAFCGISYANIPQCSFIGTNAFGGCGQLESVNLENCLTIGSSAFFLCKKLSQVNVSNCTTLSNGAFYSCTNLSQISLPNCENIASGAFYNCTSLTKISLPNCLQIQGNSTFYGCSKLSAIIFAGSNVVSVTNSVSAWSMFSYTPIRNSTYLGYYGSIYVPASLISNYISAWGASLSSRITSIENWIGG